MEKKNQQGQQSKGLINNQKTSMVYFQGLLKIWGWIDQFNPCLDGSNQKYLLENHAKAAFI